MIFLDANAFYSYFGRCKLNLSSSPVDEKRLAEYLDRQNDKSLPTSVFIEIITHFRSNPKILKELLDFRHQKCLPLYNNIPDYVVSVDEITCVSLMDEIHLTKYADKLLNDKIEIESKFTFVFLEITKNLYTYYKLESTAEFSQSEKDSILNFIGRTEYKEHNELLKEKIRKELKDGYNENKEQNVLKAFYIQELNEACILTDIIIDGCIACKDEQSDIIDSLQQAYQKTIASGMDGQGGTMPYIVDTLANDPQFLESAKLKISEMFKKGKYTNTQRAYLRDIMFTAWFERGQKLQKNDIFDMFCVGCLDYSEKRKADCNFLDLSSYIITFDKRMKSYLGAVRPRNLTIIENILN